MNCNAQKATFKIFIKIFLLLLNKKTKSMQKGFPLEKTIGNQKRNSKTQRDHFEHGSLRTS